MALEPVSTKVVPITIALAKRFRDMKPLKGERELKSSRVKRLASLVANRGFHPPRWGECRCNGTIYRGNGNHSSHLLTACLQQSSGEGLDEVSERFVNAYLFVKGGGGGWTGSTPEDLPPLKEKEINAVIDTFTADDEADLVEFFRNYDGKESVRSASDLLGIHVGEHDDLEELGRKKIGYALAGVIRAARSDPEKFELSDDLRERIAADSGSALASGKMRDAVRWIVETVPDEDLYSKVGGAQVFAEVWAAHGEEDGGRIVDEIMEHIDEENTPANKWHAILTGKRKTPTVEHLVKKGRQLIEDAARKVLHDA